MSAAAVWALCTSGALAQTNIEFIQWWEPEMPAGALRGIMDDFEAGEPRHQGHARQRPLFRHARPDRRRRRLGHAERRRRPRRRLGQRPGQAGRDRLDGPADGRRGATTAARSPTSSRSTARAYMFPLASFVYPVFVNLDLAEGRRRRRDADQPHRVRRGREEDDRRRQERVRLGAAAVARDPQRHPERRDVVGLGVRRPRC